MEENEKVKSFGLSMSKLINLNWKSCWKWALSLSFNFRK